MIVVPTIEFILFDLFPFLGVTYLLGRRSYILFQRHRYRRWLTNEKERIGREEGKEEGDVVRAFQRSYPLKETSEEREWRTEKRWLELNKTKEIEESGY